jgi:dephospho-CoA kinase
VPLIAVTGGIASGKSVVSKRLGELGAVVVDADQVARDVVQPGEPALARIAEEFGPDVIAPDGTLDRAALGAIVFRDASQREKLNAITHPAVSERSRRMFQQALDADPNAVVVYDVPLLVDAHGGGRAAEFHPVVVVVADPETRVRRMVELRGMDEAEAQRRIAAQADDAERLAVADVVIDANGSLESTLRQTDELWESLGGRKPVVD